MVTVAYDPTFEKKIWKIKDRLLKLKVKNKILKIIDSPEIGKHKRYSRKSSREIYISPFRLSYLYIKTEEKMVFLDLYHKGNYSGTQNHYHGTSLCKDHRDPRDAVTKQGI
ncbi:MAG: hypothetical protein C5S48_04135 [Candidatus Methanogaster sp.]|nr:MAG: hypothetical protein C5S48_04135 [ANME-2 cluster archaeon]